MRAFSVDREAIARIVQRTIGVGHRSGQTYAVQKRFGAVSDFVALPESVIEYEVQDTDPTSPTFGKFFPVLGIDGLVP